MKTHFAHDKISITVQTPDGPRTISTGCQTREQAQSLIKSCNVAAIEQAARAGVLTENLIRKLTVGGTVTISQAFAEWEKWITHAGNSERTSQNNVTLVNAWRVFAKTNNLRAGQVTEAHVSKWINAADGVSLGTRRVRLAALRSFFRFCGIKEYVSRDPSALCTVKAHLLSHEQKEKKIREPFTGDEFDRLTALLRERIAGLEASKERTAQEDTRLASLRFWYAATLIGRWSGLRLGDVCSLEWACFSTKGWMTVFTDKKDRRIHLPIDDDLAVGIAAIPSNNGKYCFPDQRAMAVDQHQRCTLSVQFMRLVKEAGIMGKSFHCLRYSNACALKLKGLSERQIADRLGHGSVKSQQVYLR